MHGWEFFKGPSKAWQNNFELLIQPSAYGSMAGRKNKNGKNKI